MLQSHLGLADSTDAEHLHFHSKLYWSVLVSTPGYERGQASGSAVREGTMVTAMQRLTQSRCAVNVSE